MGVRHSKRVSYFVSDLSSIDSISSRMLFQYQYMNAMGVALGIIISAVVLQIRITAHFNEFSGNTLVS
jgi:hypothetical protein